MTVSATSGTKTVLGDGILTSFDLNFTVVEAAHLAVVHIDALDVETTLTLGVDYTLSGLGYNSDCVIAYPVSGSPLPSGESLRCSRFTPSKQTLDLTLGSNLQSQNFEEALDYLALAIQDLSGLTLAEALTDSIVIGANAQPYSTKLLALADLVWANNKMPYFTGTGTLSSADLTAFARTVLDDASASAARITLELIYASQAEAEARAATNRVMSPLRTSQAISETLGEVLIVQDEKTAGVAGGTFTSGAWQTRDLNTTENNGITGASLSSNQIVLPAGTYECRISAPGLRCDNHKARLQNITDGTTIKLGTAEISASGSIYVTRSHIVGHFTLAASKTLEVQHRCTATRATDGFGGFMGVEAEIYTTAYFRKVA